MTKALNAEIVELCCNNQKKNVDDSQMVVECLRKEEPVSNTQGG